MLASSENLTSFLGIRFDKNIDKKITQNNKRNWPARFNNVFSGFSTFIFLPNTFPPKFVRSVASNDPTTDSSKFNIYGDIFDNFECFRTVPKDVKL